MVAVAASFTRVKTVLMDDGTGLDVTQFFEFLTTFLLQDMDQMKRVVEVR